MALQISSLAQHVQPPASVAKHAHAFRCSSRPPVIPRHQRIITATQQTDCNSDSSSRRQLLQAGCAAVLLSVTQLSGSARADEAVSSSSSSSASALVPYVNSQQHYQLSIPAGWEKKDKAGADVLFEDPERRSTSVGVTVSPVRIASIEQFGDLATVGQRLLEAEGKKESTLDVQLLASSSRTGSAGATLYDFEYELNSTRGVKRIFNTVTITGSKLYILNGNFKCDKEAGCAAGEGTVASLRNVASSFDAGITQ